MSFFGSKVLYSLKQIILGANIVLTLQNTTDFSTDSYSYCWCIKTRFFVVVVLKDVPTLILVDLATVTDHALVIQ